MYINEHIYVYKRTYFILYNSHIASIDTTQSARNLGFIFDEHVYDGGGNHFGGVEVKVVTDTAKSADVMVASSRS